MCACDCDCACACGERACLCVWMCIYSIPAYLLTLLSFSSHTSLPFLSFYQRKKIYIISQKRERKIREHFCQTSRAYLSLRLVPRCRGQTQLLSRRLQRRRPFFARLPSSLAREPNSKREFRRNKK